MVEGGHLHYIDGKVNKSPKLVVEREDELQCLISDSSSCESVSQLNDTGQICIRKSIM